MAAIETDTPDFSAEKLKLLKLAVQEPDDDEFEDRNGKSNSSNHDHINSLAAVIAIPEGEKMQSESYRQPNVSYSSAYSTVTQKSKNYGEVGTGHSPPHEYRETPESKYGGTGQTYERNVRKVTRSSHRSVSSTSRFRHHEHRYNSELTEKVETHFHAIVELLANTSRESASLQECWGRISSERETLLQKHDELLEQVDVITAQIDRLEIEKRGYIREISDKKREAERLLLELSTANSSLSTEKKRATERELDIERFQRELKTVESERDQHHTDFQRIRIEYELLQETLQSLQLQFDSNKEELENHQRELHKVHRERTELYTKLTDITHKYEHIKREHSTVRERLKEMERERDSLSIDLHTSREECSLLIIERDDLKEQISGCHKKHEESRNRIVELEEHFRRSESSLSKVRAELVVVKEKSKTLERERDEIVHKNGHYITEITEYKEQISHFQADLRTKRESQDKLSDELTKVRLDYEGMEDELSRYQHDYKDVELENARLRSALREARAQKERAIAARHTADRERDEYVDKYEEKCREMERLDGASTPRWQRRYIQNGLEGREGSPYGRSREVSHAESVVCKTV